MTSLHWLLPLLGLLIAGLICLDSIDTTTGGDE